MTTWPLLSILIWLPIAAGFGLFFVKGKQARTIARGVSFFVTLASLMICGQLLAGFDTSTPEMQWSEQLNWIEGMGIQYHLGIDGFSLPLIILTCLMTFLVVIASLNSVSERVRLYLAAFLIMQGLILGAFSALDAILFYTFWEGMLIPMFIIIGIWGGPNRIYATIKFFLYTFLGSVLLLVALIYLHFKATALGIPQSDTFNILVFQNIPLGIGTQKWLFIAFLIAFAVKVPMWPVHTWLPDAHVEAPTGGSVILAAILLKMGGYGFLRFILPITPDASEGFAVGMIVLSLIAIIYIGLVTIVQTDMKKLIAYSSISHMGFVTLGLFIAFAVVAQTKNTTDAAMGIEGAMIQMISHGLISGALFLCVGVLYDRLHSRMIQDYGGVINRMPIFSAFFMLFAMANAGLPGTSGFVAEWMVILSAFKAKVWYAVCAGLTLILGAAYTLWMYKRVIFGPLQKQTVAALDDINVSEKIMLLILALAILFLGIWPNGLLTVMHSSTEHLVQQMLQTKI